MFLHIFFDRNSSIVFYLSQNMLCSTLCSTYITAVNQLTRRAIEATKTRAEQVEAFTLFAGALDQILVATWTKMAQDWENDQGKPNPYAPSTKGTVPCTLCHLFLRVDHATLALTAASVRLQLAEEDQGASAPADPSLEGLAIPHGLNNITSSMFINQGMELEEQR